MIKKKIGVVTSILTISLLMIVLIMAATVVRSPIVGGNFSGTINFSVNTTLPHAHNVTINWNESGGPTNATTVLFYQFNASASQLVFENASISISGLTDATNYNFTFTIRNTTGSTENHSVGSVTIDNTIPREVNITGTETRGNYTGSITLNASVLDATAGIEVVLFNITNSLGIQNGTVTGTKSGDYYSVSLNTSQYPDGTYNITVFANDSANNVNSTKLIHTVTFDNTNPTASVSCTPDPVNAGATITCTCTITDDTSGLNSSSKIHDTSPPTSDTGTFTNTCSFADHSGNTATASTTYNVELSGTGGGGGGGGGGSTVPVSFYQRTINIATNDFSEVENIQQKLAAKERIKIKFNNKYHHIGVRELTLMTALIEVASHGETKKQLNIGDEIKIDLNSDNINDVHIKLNSIINGKADLDIRYIQESYASCIADWECSEWSDCKEDLRIRVCTDLNECHEKDPWFKDDTKPTESEACKSPIEESNLIWLWVVIGIVIAVIVYYSTKKK